MSSTQSTKYNPSLGTERTVVGPDKSGPVRIWSALEDGVKVGKIVCLISPPVMMVGVIMVDSMYRRLGHSTRMHNAAYEYAKEHDYVFSSGVINGSENKAYWEMLVAEGRACKASSTSYIRTEHL